MALFLDTAFYNLEQFMSDDASLPQLEAASELQPTFLHQEILDAPTFLLEYPD